MFESNYTKIPVMVSPSILPSSKVATAALLLSGSLFGQTSALKDAPPSNSPSLGNANLPKIAPHVRNEVRTWKDSTETKMVEGSLAGIREGKIAIRKADGTFASLDLQKLSIADQIYVNRKATETAPERKIPESTAQNACDLSAFCISRDGPQQVVFNMVEYNNLVPSLKEPIADPSRYYLKQGDVITFVGHIGNRGRAASDVCKAQWLIDAQPVGASITVNPLQPGQNCEVKFQWKWQAGPHLVALSVDPDNRLAETTKNNNIRVDAVQAASLSVPTNAEFRKSFEATKNIAGSYGYEDWVQAHMDELNRRLATSVSPAAPDGCRFRVRIETFVDEVNGPKADAARAKVAGSFPMQGDFSKMAPQFDWGLLHEWAHQLGLIDLYRFNRDAVPSGLRKRDGTWLRLQHDFQPQQTMMNSHGPHPFHEIDAAALNFQIRPDGQQTPRGFYGDFLYTMCDRYAVRLIDNDHKPLSGSTIEVFQSAGNGSTGALTKEPVCRGITDANGCWKIPNRPAAHPSTTGGFTCRDNPFGTIDVVGDNGFLVFRVTVKNREMFFSKDIVSFCVPAYRGEKNHTFELCCLGAPTTALLAPVNPKVQYVAQGKVTLSFEASASASIKEYRIYAKERHLSDNPENFSIRQTVPARTAKAIVSEILTIVQYTEFFITAVDGQGRESSCSDRVVCPGLIGPAGIAQAPDGTIFISDGHPHTGYIAAFSKEELPLDWMFNPGRGDWGRMEGIAVDPSPGNGMPYRLVTANSYAHRVHFFAPDGSYINHIGDKQGSNPGEFNTPRGVAVAPDHTVYVADSGNKRIQVFSPDGKFLREFGANILQLPIGICMDPKGRLLVADQKGQVIRVFADGKLETSIGAGALTSPAWIAVRKDGVICTSDQLAHELCFFSSAGKLLSKYSGTDPATHLSQVRGVMFDEHGDLCYVQEETSGQILRLRVSSTGGIERVTKKPLD